MKNVTSYNGSLAYFPREYGREKRERGKDHIQVITYCVDNRLETLTVSKTPSIHSFQILVTNLRNIWIALDFLIIFSIGMMQIRDNFPEIRWNYSEDDHTDLVPNKSHGNVIKLQTNIAAFTQMKNTGKVTGQAVKENKNLFSQWKLGKICIVLSWVILYFMMK